VHVAGDDEVTVAVLAPHAEAVELCLLAGDGRGGWTERRVELRSRTHGVWHDRVAGVRPGQRYGLRAHGPWEPGRGHRYDSSKLLLDPYARVVTGALRHGPEVFSHAVDDRWAPLPGAPRPALDSAARVPHGVVAAAPVADQGRRPRVPWSETVVYEAHLRGLTARHPEVPPEQRGTWAGLAHPAVVGHLRDLGVTTVELLPVHAVGDEVHLARRGATNYWGYNTLGFFAPEPRYVSRAARDAGPAAVLAEVAGAVDALHAAGLEVVLDVVYNHTCEGGADGPTLSWRGLDNAVYYRLDHAGGYVDTTGCGNTLDATEPLVVQQWLDSLRYWVTAFGIDGYRFDLAASLARGPDGFAAGHPFLVAARTDPVLATTKLVAEPWDIGPHGWRTGQFPPPFAEWNDRFRDGARTFWLADPGAGDRRGHGLREVATRLAGSADLFTPTSSGQERGPHASVNYVTAHDGFTLADLTAYERKHNEPNGERGMDGHDDNRSWNHGVEGHPVDGDVAALRRRSARNLLGTLLLATGVPMLTAGDEAGRTQEGNNNAYCLDDARTHVDWSWLGVPGDERRHLLATVRALTRLRRHHPVLRQDRVFAGRPVHADGTTDLAWFAHDGTPMHHDRWHDPTERTLQAFFHGAPVGGASLLLLLHAGLDDAGVVLPPAPWAHGWTQLWDSTCEHPGEVPAVHVAAGAAVTVSALSLRVYRADR
jgi:isoamylase